MNEHPSFSIDDTGLDHELRETAWLVAESSQRTASDLEDADEAVALLTAGLDPVVADPASVSYRFGAADALAAVLSVLRRRIPSPRTLDLVTRGKTAEVLRIILAHPGVSRSRLAVLAGCESSNLAKPLERLQLGGLVRPVVTSTGSRRGWALTEWGQQVVPGLLALAELSRDALAEEDNVVQAAGSPPGEDGADQGVQYAMRVAKPTNLEAALGGMTAGEETNDAKSVALAGR
jgi:DNA-binding HxlR family transcriptional regulator